MPHQIDAKRNAMNDATPTKGDEPKAASKSTATKPQSFLDPSIKLQNLVAKRTIGTGTFGRVKLVQDKSVRHD